MHIGDYAAATAHLSDAEDLAYRRLLDAYYAREAPLPTDEAACCRLARAASPAARKAVGVVLREFFELTPDGWRQKRANAEIARYRSKSDQARASVMVRYERERATRRTDSERSTNVPTNVGANEPTDVLLTTNHEVNQEQNLTQGQKQRPVAASPLPGWLPTDAWEEFAKARVAMKARLTPKASTLLIATLGKLREQGHDPRAVIEQSLARGWRGLFPVKPPDTARASTRQQIRATTAAAIFGADHDRPDDRTIDGTAERVA